jgi:fatty-acid desaturase
VKLVEGHGIRTFVPSNLAQVIAVHVVTLGVAPFLFTWDAFLFAIAFMFIFGYSMGLFHHMGLTHRAYRASPWLEHAGATLGTLTWRGPFAGPVKYVAMHRVHHRHSDTELDPHSPIHGYFHSLLGWYWRMPYGFTRYDLYRHLAPDLDRDRFLVFLDRHVHLVQLFWGIFCFAVGALIPFAQGGAIDWVNGIRYVVYGVFVRAFLTIYIINAVDLINHTIGYRNYATKDFSTNSWLMAFIHGGGAVSWHNNHHAHMGYMTVRKRWWEFDLHRNLLQGLGLFGWVTDIKVWDEISGRKTGEGAEPLDEEIELYSA